MATNDRSDPAAHEAPPANAGVIPLVAETAEIRKRVVERSRTRVSTETETAEQILRDSLRTEAVDVTRVAVDRELAAGESAPQVRTEGDVTVVPIFEEILVVEKRLVLKEELHIRRSATSEDVAIPVTLRRQRVEIERVGTGAAEPAQSTPSPPATETET